MLTIVRVNSSIIILIFIFYISWLNTIHRQCTTEYLRLSLEDGSYTRLKNMQLGYTFPKAFLDNYGIQNLRIYFSGSNLLTFTKYQGLDPEMTASDNARGAGDMANGIDWGTYPSARSFNVGLSLTF